MTAAAEDFENKARALIDDRMSAVRPLAQTAIEVERAQEALDSALRAHADKWSEAQKAGWTSAELTKLGVPAPKTNRAARARTTRSRKSRTPQPEQVAAQDG